MQKTILLPFDGSLSSIKAVEFVMTMLNEDDIVILINIQKPQYDGPQKVSNVTKEEFDLFYYQKGEKILERAEGILESQKFGIRKIVRIGLPSIEITKAAKEFGVHLIVMGSKGMSQVVSNALGSVTYSVIHLAPCPITIVPSHEN